MEEHSDNRSRDQHHDLDTCKGSDVEGAPGKLWVLRQRLGPVALCAEPRMGTPPESQKEPLKDFKQGSKMI